MAEETSIQLVRNLEATCAAKSEDARKGKRTNSLIILILFFIGPFPGSHASESAFDAANQLYEQGRYESSLESYQALLEKGMETPAVHFNLGNAWFRKGNTGMSIYHYLIAQTLAPMDPDIQANLKFARTSQGLPRDGIVSPLFQWLRVISLDGWAFITLGSLWAFCILKATTQLVPRLENSTVLWRRLTGWAALAGILLFLAISWSFESHHPGVVILENASLHSSPFADSKVMDSLKSGEEVLLLAEKNQWHQIRRGNGELGWLASSELRSIPKH
ncbi:MAG: tetratricopeptide repeat protein [Verrucomicrobiota bacterium]|nr:tetratricopeptide repeat protein [Verrucomicrobiota bacterium]